MSFEDKITLEYLKKRYDKILPDYKLENYIDLKNKNKKQRYYDISSNRQILSIMKNYNFKDKILLYELINKVTKINDINFISNLLNKYHSDIYIYNELRKRIKHKEDNKEEDKGIDRRSYYFVDLYYNHIYRYILTKNPDFKITKYLDIGCADCNKTYLLGKKLGLEDSQIYGVDLKESRDRFTEKEVNKYIKFSYLDPQTNKLDFPDNSFDMISMFMVFHHIDINKRDIIIREINRCLKPGGYLLFREHDTMSNHDKMLADIEHSLYDYVMKEIPDKNYINQKHYFLDWLEMDYLFEVEYNFKYVYAQYDSISIHWDVSPTRYYYLFFQKSA
jgi:SAM-dependent methyltransferase